MKSVAVYGYQILNGNNFDNVKSFIADRISDPKSSLVKDAANEFEIEEIMGATVSELIAAFINCDEKCTEFAGITALDESCNDGDTVETDEYVCFLLRRDGYDVFGSKFTDRESQKAVLEKWAEILGVSEEPKEYDIIPY